MVWAGPEPGLALHAVTGSLGWAQVTFTAAHVITWIWPVPLGNQPVTWEGNGPWHGGSGACAHAELGQED